MNELVIIAGPTGIGKTALAVSLAEHYGTEVISADSRQVYREMSVGTAVPSPEEIKGVPHHFLQSISIHDYFSASVYEKQVLALLPSLFKKYPKVIMTGGTGLYIDAVRKGIDDLPDPDMAVRNRLHRQLAESGLGSLQVELKRLDPVCWDVIDRNNPMRVLKALEVCLSTGRPYSSFLEGRAKDRPFTMRTIALATDRDELYRRINERALRMIDRGWIAETQGLLQHRDLNALNTVGYKELFAYLDGLYTLDEAIQRIQANTRKYARKQITWFRKDPLWKWFRPDQVEEIIQYIDYE